MLNLVDEECGKIHIFVAKANLERADELVTEDLEPLGGTSIKFSEKVSKSGATVQVACIGVDDVYDYRFASTYEFLVDAKIPAIITTKTEADCLIFICSAQDGNPEHFAISVIESASWIGVMNAVERIADEVDDLDAMKKAFKEYRESFNADFGVLIDESVA